VKGTSIQFTVWGNSKQLGTVRDGGNRGERKTSGTETGKEFRRQFGSRLKSKRDPMELTVQSL
jgi:hypothetical protein